ncbi:MULTISPECIES: energy transducer TonB [unclassified Flavobacterium]|uniref:energy transducer TonB n=1 Tax=unclassified Flavobacterium TaxID=196869 RepID=UPI0025BDF879|nr:MULTISPECIES: energy transducer TonB [unclassified Flavobacterium]
MKTILLSVSTLLFTVLSVSAQQKTYVNNKGELTGDMVSEQYQMETRLPDSIHKIKRLYKTDGDVLISEVSLLSETRVPDGKTQLFNPDGSVEWFIHYRDGTRHGESKTFWPGGRLKREETFSNGQLVVGKSYDESGNEVAFFPREKMPEYPGGIKEAYAFVAHNFHVKGTATGSIIVTFVVEKDGTVTEVTVKKGVSRRLDKEAIRVVESMPKWSPGMQEGKPVRAIFSLPIKIADE